MWLDDSSLFAGTQQFSLQDKKDEQVCQRLETFFSFLFGLFIYCNCKLKFVS
jgi:hypothetical protein